MKTFSEWLQLKEFWFSKGKGPPDSPGPRSMKNKALYNHRYGTPGGGLAGGGGGMGGMPPAQAQPLSSPKVGGMPPKRMKEVNINKDFDPIDGGMHYWNTQDDLGHVSFSIQGNTMHVDFLRNQDEYDPSDKGPAVNMVAILRELRNYLREHPEITRITANVQNRDVKKWLLGMGARIIRGGSIPVMELPVANVVR